MIIQALGVLLFVFLAGGVGILLRRWWIDEQARSRWFESDREAPPSVTRDSIASVSSGPLARRWWWVGWPLAGIVFAALWLLLQWPVMIAGALGLIIALLIAEFEAWWAMRRKALIETQLADAIDLMVGALGVGASVESAMQAVVEECRHPLRREFELAIARIRLGDAPRDAFRGLTQRVPLETFLLFGTTLAVHWEVGGSLAPVLASLGRTVRDRTETSRRIASNIVQSQLSTVFILLLTYFIAAVVWRNTPDQMAKFVETAIGQSAVALTMVLQAIGIVWMNVVSKPRF